MRFQKFLREDVVQTALGIKEPEVGKKYSDEYIKKRKDIIDQAIDTLNSKGADDEATEAMIADLLDKQEKWNNVKRETEPPEPPKSPEDTEADDPTSQDDPKPVDADKSDKANYPIKPDEKREKEEEKDDAERQEDDERDDQETERDREQRKKRNTEVRKKMKKQAQKNEQMRLIRSILRNPSCIE